MFEDRVHKCNPRGIIYSLIESLSGLLNGLIVFEDELVVIFGHDVSLPEAALRFHDLRVHAHDECRPGLDANQNVRDFIDLICRDIDFLGLER